MKRYLIFLATLFITYTANAQDALKGTVVELGSNSKISTVFIHDINSKKVSLADEKGRFEINTATGHTIVFDSPGYVSDTLFVADMRPVKVELKPMGTVLNEVNITSTRVATFDPRAEYPEVYEKSKVYVFSPSTWFSGEAKRARRLKKYFDSEERERYVDKYYTATYVGSLVPLKGEELRTFMAMYRPSYAYVKSNTGPSLAVYVNDSYKKYKALPADKRVLPTLNNGQ
ncbi:carboxypeptidase-like regulatory domain-containing protein [Mucilaginibacter corticis]|uniref:Carboxypeptidase-like regulatory domain-containing protein n=1 Tax=Mucilaginibacter corticis TaxID=2597670 RepID=A0A556MXF9_9SPHI|nr:carboxypeptidase-like regulatory domain-containing protein [Mucilaginibacter corticis]TSJ44575.1 carboxypeptidase-like regulatory domain-containing protein [Mucilaginibacter corticis]